MFLLVFQESETDISVGHFAISYFAEQNNHHVFHMVWFLLTLCMYVILFQPGKHYCLSSWLRQNIIQCEISNLMNFIFLNFFNFRHCMCKSSYFRFVDSMVYYGLSLNTSNLGGNDFVNFIVMGGVEIPAFIIGVFILNRVGRKWPQSLSLLLSGAALLLTMAVPEGNEFIITGFFSRVCLVCWIRWMESDGWMKRFTSISHKGGFNMCSTDTGINTALRQNELIGQHETTVQQKPQCISQPVAEPIDCCTTRLTTPPPSLINRVVFVKSLLWYTPGQNFKTIWKILRNQKLFTGISG